MNQYSIRNAVFRIDGYYTPPRDKNLVESEFKRAQTECINNFKRYIADIEAISLDEFLKNRAPATNQT